MVCDVQSHIFETWRVVCVLVVGSCVRASIAVPVAFGLLLEELQGVLGEHASAGHP